MIESQRAVRTHARFDHESEGVHCTMTQFVAIDAPVKITTLELTNTGTVARELAVNERGLAVLDRVAGHDVAVHRRHFVGVALSVVSSPSSRVNLKREVITS